MNLKFTRCAAWSSYDVLSRSLALWPQTIVINHKKRVHVILLQTLWNHCGESVMIDVSSLCFKHTLNQPWKKTKVNSKASLLQKILSQSLLDILSGWIFAPFQTSGNYTSRVRIIFSYFGVHSLPACVFIVNHRIEKNHLLRLISLRFRGLNHDYH